MCIIPNSITVERFNDEFSCKLGTVVYEAGVCYFDEPPKMLNIIDAIIADYDCIYIGHQLMKVCIRANWCNDGWSDVSFD